MARSPLAHATSFAHLISLGRTPATTPPRAAEDDDERKQKEGESDDDYKNRMDKLDDEEAKAKAKAEEDEKKKEEEEARAKAKAEEDGKTTDDDEADDADAKASAARGRERARCAAIFAEPAAARRPDIAAHLAFGTNMTRTAAIDTLKAVAAGERAPPPETVAPGLRSRMAREPVYDVGSETERTGKDSTPAARAATFAAKVAAADKKRLGGA